ncbi:spore germination protein GerPC [Bacillus songklensis]|uniref:Spore germination protein GerPC n=1 Tax=Bacillus songklensis TaxID=1069116 RepID=A0ABV8B2A9_9BACI
MDYLQQLHHYVQQLAAYIQRQNDRIQNLEQSIAQLKNQVKELEEKPTTQIERIEYKFDQLKVETLEGTLNIGLNPTVPESIEDFNIGTQLPPGTVDAEAQIPPGSISPGFSPGTREIPTEWVDDIHEQVKRELEEQGTDIINAVLEERQLKIADPYYEFIIEDIKKQLKQRVVFHLQELDPASININEQELKLNIIAKVREEITRGIHAFLTYLPDSLKKGG